MKPKTEWIATWIWVESNESQSPHKRTASICPACRAVYVPMITGWEPDKCPACSWFPTPPDRLAELREKIAASDTSLVDVPVSLCGMIGNLNEAVLLLIDKAKDH